MSAAIRRPIMRYHGGKFRIAPWVISHFPAHKIYVEPYGGAGSVLIRKPRSPVEIYNDLDERVVNVFRVLRDPEGATELERRLRLTPWARAEFNLAYEPTGEPVEDARRLLVMQMMGFGSSALVRGNTGFRASSYRARNRDYSKDWATYPEAISAFRERLRGVTIECRSALGLISMHDTPDTLIYVDPPYPHATRSPVAEGQNGYVHEMSGDDHRALAAALRGAASAVVLSGYPCDLYDKELYPDWRRVQRQTMANGQKQGVARTEVLWLNGRAAAGLRQLSLFGGTA